MTETSTQQPSGFVQSMVAQLLCGNWGMDGWVKWLEGLRDAYEERMEGMCAELENGRTVIETRDTRDITDDYDDAAVEIRKHVLFSFVKPDGGMFVWVRVHIADHPAFEEYTAKHSKAEMMEKLWDFVAVEERTLPSPGGIFAPTPEIEKGMACEYFRFCFAAIDYVDVRNATKRFGDGMRKFWKLSVGEIERVGTDDHARGAAGVEAEKSWLGGIGC
jgi:DNA-binding transcriptional MocR family regulator